MKLNFLTTATMTCLEATDCAALKIVETLEYQIVSGYRKLVTKSLLLLLPFEYSITRDLQFATISFA